MITITIILEEVNGLLKLDSHAAGTSPVTDLERETNQKIYDAIKSQQFKPVKSIGVLVTDIPPTNPKAN